MPDLRSSERALLHLLRIRGALSKAELARLSDMSAQGVSIIVERLLDLDLVRKGSKKRGRVGQPSTPIELNPEGAVSLGIFVGNDVARLVIIDFAGEIIRSRSVEYDDPRSDDTSRRLFDAAEEIVASVEAAFWGRRVGIGLSANATLLRRLNRPGSAASEQDMRLVQRLESRFGVPVYCFNDIRAACLAELTKGGGMASMTTLYFHIGETFGSGLILEGRLIGAENEHSSALHSLPISGSQGAKVEDFAALNVLRRQIDATGLDLYEEVAAGFPNTRDAFDQWKQQAVSALGLAIRAACATVNVERVLIASRLGDDDLAGLVNELRFAVETDSCASLRTPEISVDTVGPHPRAWGSAIVPFLKVYGPLENERAGAPGRSAVA